MIFPLLRVWLHASHCCEKFCVLLLVHVCCMSGWVHSCRIPCHSCWIHHRWICCCYCLPVWDVEGRRFLCAPLEVVLWEVVVHLVCFEFVVCFPPLELALQVFFRVQCYWVSWLHRGISVRVNLVPLLPFYCVRMHSFPWWRLWVLLQHPLQCLPSLSLALWCRHVEVHFIGVLDGSSCFNSYIVCSVMVHACANVVTVFGVYLPWSSWLGIIKCLYFAT